MSWTVVGAIGHLGLDVPEPAVLASHYRSDDASILSHRMAALSAEATGNVTKYALPRLVALPSPQILQRILPEIELAREVFDISCRAKMRKRTNVWLWTDIEHRSILESCRTER